jgi:hypothetical protein
LLLGTRNELPRPAIPGNSGSRPGSHFHPYSSSPNICGSKDSLKAVFESAAGLTHPCPKSVLTHGFPGVESILVYVYGCKEEKSPFVLFFCDWVQGFARRFPRRGERLPLKIAIETMAKRSITIPDFFTLDLRYTRQSK